MSSPPVTVVGEEWVGAETVPVLQRKEHGIYMARRRGKVARLPDKIRDEVNQKLRDGVTYADICRWLAKHGYKGISKDSITEWFKGGHADWLREQAALECARAEGESIIKFAQENGSGKLGRINEETAKVKLFETLLQMNPEIVVAALQENPEVYVKLLNTMLRLNQNNRYRGKPR